VNLYIKFVSYGEGKQYRGDLKNGV